MSAVQAVVATCVGLFILVGAAFAGWQLLKAADKEAELTRLRSFNADYLERLNYIEPKHRALEQQVDVLLALHDPSAEHAEIIKLLHGIKRLAEQIDHSLYAPREQPNDRPGRADA